MVRSQVSPKFTDNNQLSTFYFNYLNYYMYILCTHENKGCSFLSFVTKI